MHQNNFATMYVYELAVSIFKNQNIHRSYGSSLQYNQMSFILFQVRGKQLPIHALKLNNDIYNSSLTLDPGGSCREMVN